MPDSQTENYFFEMAKFAILEVDMNEKDEVPTDVDTHWRQRNCHKIMKEIK